MCKNNKIDKLNLIMAIGIALIAANSAFSAYGNYSLCKRFFAKSSIEQCMVLNKGSDFALTLFAEDR